MVCRRAEVLLIARDSQGAEARIDLAAACRAEHVGNPIADPLEHGHGSCHAGEILGRCVNTQLLGPEMEALDVDLCRRAMP